MATNRPFTFLVLGLEAIPALEAQGHTLIYCNEITFTGEGIAGKAVIDKVVGPNCWRLEADQLRWINLSLKEMRALQPKVKKVKKGKDGTATS